MLRSLLIALVLMVFILGSGKLSFAQHDHSEHAHGSEAVVTNALSQGAVNVGNKICPVSGEKVGQGGMEPATYEYEGKIYNFCCFNCVEEFKKDPEKYIKKVDEELQGKS